MPNTENTRKHLTPLGLLPSVTAILRVTQTEKSKETLRKWQHKFDKINGIGAANTCSEEARHKGTIIHGLIRELLEGKLVYHEYPELARLKGFLATLEPIALETTIYHPSGYSGIVDCVAKIDKNLYLIDWKTSKREKRRSFIDDYFIQTSAYAQGWNYLHPETPCDKLMIVVLGPKLQLFEESLNDILPFWQARLNQFFVGDFVQ